MAGGGVSHRTSSHRKELVKPEQHPHPETGSRAASSSSRSSHSEEVHAGQAFLSQEMSGAEIRAEDTEATDQQTQILSDETPEKPLQGQGDREESLEEEGEEESAVMNREETEAAAVEGLRDALKTTDKEASVDIKVDIPGSTHC